MERLEAEEVDATALYVAIVNGSRPFQCNPHHLSCSVNERKSIRPIMISSDDNVVDPVSLMF